MAPNKEVYELMEGLLSDKKIRFDWFMHVTDPDKLEAVRNFSKEGKLVVMPFAVIVGVLDEDTGKLETEGCMVLKFTAGEKALHVIPATNMGDGTYGEGTPDEVEKEKTE